MPLKFNNLVSINLNAHLRTSDFDDEDRDTVALILKYESGNSADCVIDSLESLTKINAMLGDGSGVSEEDYYKYICSYFANGGKKLHIYRVIENTPVDDLYDICTKLPMKEIAVVTNYSLDVIKGCIEKDTDSELNLKFTGSYQKMFIKNITNIPAEISRISTMLSNYNTLDNLCLQAGVDGSEMCIAAYLSQIKLDRANSVSDYCYSLVKDYPAAADNYKIVKKSLLDDNDTIVELYNNNVNTFVELVNDYRSYGGNLIDGSSDLVNKYMLITLYQTISIRLINVLKSKIKYNSDGINKISAALSNELERYVTNGYLTQDKIADEDLIYNGYTLVNKNTAIQEGYKFLILPLHTLDEADRKEHRLPNIYLIIADSVGVRSINISGEIY